MKNILGYTDKLTVRSGEEIAFKVSAQEGAPYRAQLVRLINGDTHSKAAAFKEIELPSSINGVYRAQSQPVWPGSCVVVDRASCLDAIDAMTMVVTFMSTAPGRGRQHLLSRWDHRTQTGWSLHLNPDGRLAFIAVDGAGRHSTVQTSRPVAKSSWYSSSLRISWASRTITLECVPLAESKLRRAGTASRAVAEVNGDAPSASIPVVIAAGFGGLTRGGLCIPAESFNGRIEAPVIYRDLLTDNEVHAVMRHERPAFLHKRLIADWDFSLGIDSTIVTDRSPHGLHGYTHNLPLRGVRGNRWNGEEMNWRHAPEHYGAIHFHTDDLYDCGWLTDLTFKVPDRLRSGVYALRLRLTDEPARTIEDAHEEYLPFFIAAPKSEPQSKLALLLPTHTYMAYGNVRCWDAEREASGLSKRDYYEPIWTGPGNGDYSVALSEHPNLASSTYDRHLDGSPVHTSSWLRPLLNLRPKSVLWTFCADLLITDWLEAQGVDYDIITDDLVHQEGVDLLKSYRVIMTGNHPEYHTTAQLDAMESYLGEGGRLMYLGGNGFYWRCAVHPSSPGVIEVRRGRTGTGTWTSEVGEDGLSFTGEFGGICRDIGRAPQRLVGVGFIAEGHDASYFRILPEARASRADFAFEGLEGDIVGDFGIFGTAVGQEIDKTSSARGTPAHTVVLARSENHSPDMVYVIEEMNPVDPDIAHYRSQTQAEIVFFETPQGGAVFSVGSMAWCGSLSHQNYNNNVSTMTANVLRRFLDPAHFEE